MSRVTVALLLAAVLGCDGGPRGDGAFRAEDADVPAASGAGAPTPGADGWYAALEPALAAARADGRDVLVLFTGSDWCAPCARLEAEVLAAPAFEEAVRGRYALARLDFPRTREAAARVPDPARNAALQVAHGVTDFPTLLALDGARAAQDADGRGAVFARLGYAQGGAAPFVAVLEDAAAARDDLEAAKLAVARATASPGAALDAARLDALDVLERRAASPYAAVLRDAVAPLTSDEARAAEGGEARARRALAALAAASALDEELMERALRVDPRNEEGLLLAAVRSLVSAADDPEAVARAVAWAERLGRSGGVLDGPAAAEVWARAAGWADAVLDDRGRARWFAGLALSAGGLAPAERARMEALSRPRGG